MQWREASIPVLSFQDHKAYRNMESLAISILLVTSPLSVWVKYLLFNCSCVSPPQPYIACCAIMLLLRHMKLLLNFLWQKVMQTKCKWVERKVMGSIRQLPTKQRNLEKEKKKKTCTCYTPTHSSAEAHTECTVTNCSLSLAFYLSDIDVWCL